MSTFETSRWYSGVNSTAFAKPTPITAGVIGQSIQNVLTGEIFHCTNTVDGTSWAGSQGTLVSPATYILSDDNPSLVAFYTMENIIGTSLRDSSLNGNHMSMNTGAVQVSGHIGSALSYGAPGTTSYTGQLVGTTQGCISAWINADVSTESIGTPEWVGVNGTNSTSLVFNFATGVATYDTILSSVSVSKGTTNFTMNINTWFHVAYQSNGTDVEVYINGVLHPLTFSVSTDIGAWSIDLSSPVIGLTATTADASPTDQVRVFDRFLTQEEITVLSQEGV